MIQAYTNRTFCNVLCREIDSEMAHETAMHFFWGWVNPQKMWVCSSWQQSSHQQKLENKSNVEKGGFRDGERVGSGDIV